MRLLEHERRRARRRFAKVAPRLELAHRQALEERERESDARVRAAQAVLKARRLVAHRELQLLRAPATEGSRKKRARYERHRAGKLEEAHRELEAALERARRLGLDPS